MCNFHCLQWKYHAVTKEQNKTETNKNPETKQNQPPSSLQMKTTNCFAINGELLVWYTVNSERLQAASLMAMC